MGKKAKTSRKGKKAWRANISSEDIHEFFDKSTRDAQSGGSLKKVPSESLFFVDKSSDLSVKLKIEKNRENVLWRDSILQKNPLSNLYLHQHTGRRTIKSLLPLHLLELLLKLLPRTQQHHLPEWLAYGLPQKYFLDADGGSNDDDSDDSEPENRDENGNIRPKKAKKVTRVELNKRARRKEVLRREKQAKKVKELSKEIDSLPNIILEIEKENKEKEKRRIRRVVAKQERLKVRPPRLGKRKFEPAPTQVLLAEEIMGSLRKLKACFPLARDRFKRFEKRGLIVPSAKTSRRN